MKEFKQIKKDIITQLNNVPYKDGDLSDIGNEIGFAIGKYTMLYDGLGKEEFITGLEHGISLKDGTH